MKDDTRSYREPPRNRLIPIAVQYGVKKAYIERDSDRKLWRVWTHYDKDIKHGTFLLLFDSGRVERHIINEDGTENSHVVKPESGGEPRL